MASPRFWREPQVTSRTISCPGSPLPQRFASFNVIAPCMAAEFPLLADSMMAKCALQTLSPTYPRQSIPLMKLGVSGSTLLRTVARAWEWLQQCPPVFIDESLLPLVLLRMAIKFERGTRHMEAAALEILEPLDEEQASLPLESRLVEALWRGPGDLPLPLPMARDDRPTTGGKSSAQPLVEWRLW